MSIIEIFVVAFCLSMDAFAVSMCKGVMIKDVTIKHMLTVGFYFGLFQAFMPVIGYLLGFSLYEKIEVFDHYIILLILFTIGICMLKESKGDSDVGSELDFKNMIILSLATSIDAMSVGITLSLLDVSIFSSCLIIGILTFVLSSIGVLIGNIFGKKYRYISCIIGGFMLILMGIKIFLEHLGIINF